MKNRPKTKHPARQREKNFYKAAVIERLRESFDYCIAKLGVTTEDQMKRQFQVGWFQRPEASGGQILLGMYVRTAHRRAQAEVYIASTM